MFVEFEPGKKYAKSLDEISDNHDSFQDAGWLLNDNDFVIDVDNLDKAVIKKMINIFGIGTQIVWTDRGAHFYFKKPKGFKRGANRISPLGFPYEIKHKGNTPAVTIKRNGKLREIENSGVREDPPFIFSSGKKHDILLGLDEGEGRNEKLFHLRASLGQQTDWRKILDFVNENIFAQPLDQDEMDVLTREMSIQATDDNEYEMASWLIRKLNFIKYGERYYFKNDNGDYVHEMYKVQRIIYDHAPGKNTRYVDEVLKQMQYRCKIIDPETVFKIKLRNGYLMDGEFVPIVIDEFTPYVLNIEYDPEAEPVEEVDNYLNHLSDHDPIYRNLLLEVLGHTLIVNPEFKRMLAKFFIFIGDGGNGKGTLLQIIRMILGTRNVTGMGIKELSDERYMPSFKGMLANLGDDIQDQAIDDKDMKTLKNISTCDYISTRELYKGAESLYFTGSLIFASNHILKSWEKGESYKRRVMWLPMYTKVTKKDPLFITKLTTEKALEYWISLVIEGYKRLYKNGKFTVSDKVEKFNEQYHRENNPALDFIDGMDGSDFDGVPLKDVYDQYEDWCEDNAVKFNRNLLSDVITDSFGMDKKVCKINGKSTRCFVLKD